MSDPLAALRRVNVSSLTAAHAHGRPDAFVVPRPGETVPELDELRGWLADRLAAYKPPRALIVCGELPRNPSGEVQKFLLRERLATS